MQHDILIDKEDISNQINIDALFLEEDTKDSIDEVSEADRNTGRRYAVNETKEDKKLQIKQLLQRIEQMKI